MSVLLLVSQASLLEPGSCLNRRTTWPSTSCHPERRLRSSPLVASHPSPSASPPSPTSCPCVCETPPPVSPAWCVCMARASYSVGIKTCVCCCRQRPDAVTWFSWPDPRGLHWLLGWNWYLPPFRLRQVCFWSFRLVFTFVFVFLSI